MENLKKVLSQNLIKFRLNAGLTQLQLAEKLNYSDKSISKWERGEGMPDISVLVQLSEFYGVTLNDFVSDNSKTSVLPKKSLNLSHTFITTLSTGLVWFIASICFVVLFIIPSTKAFSWLSFIYAIPVSGIVLLVFSCLWGNEIKNIIASSIILWGSILSICLTVSISSIWILCVIAIFFQILIVVWFIFVRFKKQSKILKTKIENLEDVDASEVTPVQQ